MKGLISFSEKYRETGFAHAMTTAKKIGIEMAIDPVFPQKRVICRKKIF